MANQEFAVRLETPWKEPEGFAEPTAEQWSGGVVVMMTASLSGAEQSLNVREYFLMDPTQVERLIGFGYVRYATEREIKCAHAVGDKWPKHNGVKAPKAAKAKSKEDAPEEG